MFFQLKTIDCNKSDLCMSFEDLKIKVKKYKPKAVWIVHIGGHIAFEIDKIANYCKQNKIIILLENINTKLIRISFYLNQYIN